jgi:hypothetical protein
MWRVGRPTHTPLLFLPPTEHHPGAPVSVSGFRTERPSLRAVERSTARRSTRGACAAATSTAGFTGEPFWRKVQESTDEENREGDTHPAPLDAATLDIVLASRGRALTPSSCDRRKPPFVDGSGTGAGDMLEPTVRATGRVDFKPSDRHQIRPAGPTAFEWRSGLGLGRHSPTFAIGVSSLRGQGPQPQKE